jgi:alkylation response protein AidB-like acyl-CoA dehydrogenase
VRFHLSPEQEALKDSVFKTAQRACPAGRRRALLEASSDFDPAVWAALMEIGLGGLLIPEDQGGVGLGLEEAALAFEALGQQATPGPYMGHVLAGWALAQCDEGALKSRWLAKLARGETVAALALSDWTPETRRLAIEGGRLSGQIGLVPGADRADLLIVGVSDGIAIVERGAQVAVEPVAGSDLTRRLWRVSLTSAPAVLILEPSVGQRLVDAALVLLAAGALGGAEQCLSLSVDYAKHREQFGVVIGQFQALKHQLANMALEVEPARALVWYAAHAWDLGLPDATRVAAHAKAHLADRFVSVTRMAVQVHGGIGYTWNYDLQIWFRRSLFDRAFMGAPSLHRARAADLAGW